MLLLALHSKEPLEDLLIPHIGSTNGLHGDLALCFTEGVVAPTDWNNVIRIIACSMGSGHSFWTKWQSPGAGTWINWVRGSANQVGIRERSVRRCGRRRPSGFGRAWN